MSTPQERLKTYRAKRDFSVTAEPSGSGGRGDTVTAEPSGSGGRGDTVTAEPSGSGGRGDTVTAEPSGAAGAVPAGSSRFVVQRHRARRLHYDLRLEMGGVLVSWAVPRGPTLDPKARQLAVHVEDHPLEYFDFEGVIPKGEYGGGDVVVWDWGTWSHAKPGDPLKAVEKGDLHFDLQGEKLAGRFVLVRRDKDGPDRTSTGKEQWLLLHKNDDDAVPGWDPEEHPRSVKSGLTNDEVAAAPEALWRSDLPASEASVALGHGARPTWDPPTGDELAALDTLGPKGGTWALQGRELKLTNLDKVLFPPGEDGRAVTKRDVIRYYARVAPFMLPYVYDRPLNMHRYPDGVDKPGFWHKEVPGHAPEWLRQWHNTEADPGETRCYAVVDGVPALVWMANFGALELHAWTSRLPDVHQPTWALIDVDPGTTSTFDDVLLLSRLYRTALGHLGVVGMPKVTGKRGVQIWIPIAEGYSFGDTRAWVEKVSRAVGNTVPELVSWEWHKDRRSGLARLDYTQNAINKTLVAPFSTRPSPGAPVSVPIRWEELDDPEIRPDRWNIGTVIDRLATVGDPLAPLIGRHQKLPKL